MSLPQADPSGVTACWCRLRGRRRTLPRRAGRGAETGRPAEVAQVVAVAAAGSWSLRWMTLRSIRMPTGPIMVAMPMMPQSMAG